MKKISFIITAYNEEDNVIELHKQIESEIKNNNLYEYEYIFIENGSTDNTFQNLVSIKQKSNNVKILKLSRNFGFDGGITAGLDFTDSDAAIIMTANLQDSPKVIPQFIKGWEDGYEMVYGIVKSRPGKSIFRKINSKIFYSIITKMTNNLIPKGVSDFRLVDRKVIEALKQIRETNRFYRGFFSWVGFKSKGVEFERQERFSGESKATTLKVFGFALRGLFAFSQYPLRVSIFFSILFTISSISVLGIQTYKWISYGVPFDGYGTIIGLLLLISALLFGVLAIVSQYVALIFEETKSRPLYIIDETF